MPFSRNEWKMINSKLNSGGRWWIVSAIVLGVLTLGATPGFGQAAPAAAPAADAKADAKAETPATTPAAPEAKTTETTAAPKTEETGAKTPPTAPGTGLNVEAAPAAPAALEGPAAQRRPQRV